MFGILFNLRGDKMQSLLELQKEPFHKMVKITSGGAFGGDDPQWVQGEQFTGIATKQSSTQSIIAQKEYAIGNYIVTAMTDITLNKGDYIKRVSDGLILKITEPNNNTAPPSIATIPIKSQAYAEESVLI